MEYDLEQLWDECKEEASEEGREEDFKYLRDKVAEKLGEEPLTESVTKYKPLFT
jgi:hypothetical protein